ncbi:MAG: hypothetical protein IIA27_10610 [Gemmatimonadetes bacterium]|nr:hypothetical protein [Gemmatimonadota bacterium]
MSRFLHHGRSNLATDREHGEGWTASSGLEPHRAVADGRPARAIDVSHPIYDVSQDDERFTIFGQIDPSADAELTVVENFLEELKAKVGELSYELLAPSCEP